jgi:hypothetical protein
MEFKQNEVYIIKGKQPSNRSTYMKVRILEVTDKTIFVHNLDALQSEFSNGKFRMSITDFKTQYEVLEKVNEPEYKRPFQPM